MSFFDKYGAACSCASFGYLYILNERDWKSALKYYRLVYRFYPEIINDGYFKSNMEYCQRSLGLINCKKIRRNCTLYLH